MRRFMIAGWLLLPVGAWAYHEGPGQDGVQLDLVDAELSAAREAAEARVAELEKQVAPGKSRSTQTPSAAVTTDERIWTRSEIAQAYSDNSKGKYTPEEWAPLEREIAAAQANERVDYSK